MVETITRTSPIPVHVLVRPREGGFVFSDEEVTAMTRTIAELKPIGVKGIVSGALTGEGGVDRSATERLLRAARPLVFTFHRAFDAASDPGAALDR